MENIDFDFHSFHIFLPTLFEMKVFQGFFTSTRTPKGFLENPKCLFTEREKSVKVFGDEPFPGVFQKILWSFTVMKISVF
jgi:hypothetical protein